MTLPIEQIDSLRQIIFFAILSGITAFVWAPAMTKILYKYNITRRNDFDATMSGDRKAKQGVPIMGGLLVIITVAVITVLFNWERRFTWVPIGVMLLAATLGAVDDLMNNVIGKKTRRTRKIKQVLRLIRVHSSWKARVWLTLTLPWSVIKRTSLWLGSHPGKGLHVHERLIVQFIAGAVTAWWVYAKLGAHWQEIKIPFDGYVNVGIWIVPLIILFVMFTVNAVNVADGMDGLAGGSLIVTFSALSLLAWLEGYQEIGILNATTAGSLIAYTYFNIKPARFQMGDVGSLGIGALLAINAIVMNQMLLLPLFAFIFYIEMLSVIIQVAGRHLLGRRIFRMAPIHHHYELKGWSEEKTVMRFCVAHAGVVLLGLWIALF